MTYTYCCKEKECNQEFEIVKGINEEIDIKCPRCQSENVKRIFKSTGVIWRCDGAFGKVSK